MSQSKMNQVLSPGEQVSALVDGQLQGADFAAAVEAVSQDDDARERWQLYHLVGDVLRAPELATRGRDDAFLARLQPRVQAERLPATHVLPAHEAPAPAPDRPAANDAVFRWKMVAGLASLAAVAVMGWNLAGRSGGDGAQLAQRPPQGGATLARVAEDSAAQVMIRDPRLDELLAAHRQVGAGPALQEASGFLRNATFAAPER